MHADNKLDINETAQDKEKALKKKLFPSQLASAYIEHALAVMKTLATVPYPANIPLGIAQAIAGMKQIKSMKQQNAMLSEGGEFITSGTTDLTVGEAGRELVQVTPLERRGLNHEGGGSTINVTFTGNVNSEDFIVNEAIPMINEAVRRGIELRSSHTASGEVGIS